MGQSSMVYIAASTTAKRTADNYDGIRCDSVSHDDGERNRDNDGSSDIDDEGRGYEFREGGRMRGESG